MITTQFFLDAARRSGIELYSGVPCSYLTPLINATISSPETRYVGATNEGDAVAIAAGAELGGKHAAVMFQNSGFGNAVSPLSSLTHTFQIPLLLMVTWRGQPGGPADEPQHELMGGITPPLFDLLEIPWRILPDNEAGCLDAFEQAQGHLRKARRPFAFLIRKETFAPCPLEQDQDRRPLQPPIASPPADEFPAFDADAVLQQVAEAVGPADAVIATTGFTGRALYAQGDRPNFLYMVGSMGCASSLALGLALARPDRRVVVLDGDGAFLMRMGAVATIGYERPANLTHILLDNGVHDSTGAQATVSPSIDPVAVARACGYPHATRVTRLAELSAALRQPSESLALLHVKTRPRADRKLPRPEITPPEVAQRFRQQMSA